MMVKSERSVACPDLDSECPTGSECSLEWPDSEAEDVEAAGGGKDKGRRAPRQRRGGRARSPTQVS